MKGIRQQGKNSWQIQIYTGTGADGKPQRRFMTVHGTKKDAEKKRNELLVTLAKGEPIPMGRLTVAEHLRNWLNGYVKTNCSMGTLHDYQRIAEKHLIPALGQIQLKDLNPQVIQAYYGKACDRLSARSVHQHHRVLSQSLKYGLRQGCLGRNVCELVDPPSPHKKTMRTFDPGRGGDATRSRAR